MAFSKEATGFELERGKKTEVSEDSGEPFYFTFVSGINLLTTKAVLFTVVQRLLYSKLLFATRWL